MKSSHLRTSAALALTLALAACGGKEAYTVKGTITNTAFSAITPLGNAGLVLENTKNGDTVTVPAGATTFSFPKTIDYGEEFNVTVKTQPNHMTCVVPSSGTTNAGSAGHNVEIAAVVGCAQNAYTIGGTITGLQTSTLILTNGATTFTPAVASPVTATLAYSFDSVAVGNTYGMVIQSAPAGYTCVFTNANNTGVMGDLPAAAATDATITSPVMNIDIKCSK